MQILENAPKVNSNDKFIKGYKKLNKYLPPVHEKLVEVIYNRLELSNANKLPEFYDKDEHKYFAVASRDTLADILWCSPRQVGKLVKRLRDLGYFYTKQQKDKPLKFFSYNFNIVVKEKSATTSKKDMLPNKTELELTNKHKDTNDTSRVESSQLNADDKLVNYANNLFSHLKPKQEIKINHNVSDNQDSKHLNHAVKETNAIPRIARKQINIIANMLHGNNEQDKYEFIYNINGIIFNTKYQVSESYNLKDYFRWENNNDLVDMLNSKIYEMIYSAYITKHPDNNEKYLYGALYNFFEDIAKRKLGITIKHKQYNIPKKKSNSKGKHRIHEKTPFWEKDNYKPKFNKLNPKKKKAIQERLKQLDAKLG